MPTLYASFAPITFYYIDILRIADAQICLYPSRFGSEWMVEASWSQPAQWTAQLESNFLSLTQITNLWKQLRRCITCFQI